MLDPLLIKNHPDKIAKAAKDKGITIDASGLKKLDNAYRTFSATVQEMQSRKNKAAKEKNIEEGKKIKDELRQREYELRDLEIEYNNVLRSLPNLPASDVKVGKDESENEIVRKYKEPTKFDFTPNDHVTLGKALDVIDVEKSAEVAGTRFAYLKNEAVLLEFALVQFALSTLTKEGFVPMIPPALIKKKITEGLGYWQAGGHEDYYVIKEKDEEYYLIGTAEHSMIPYHMGDTFDKTKLPLRYVGFSPAFRREAGSYGRDTKGILRVHQFDKLEMISFVPEEESDKEHENLLAIEERLFQKLDVPYQVVKMCTGDLGFPVSRKYDIEAWIPSQNKYRELTSVSTVTDFQSRRFNIKYKDAKEKKYVYVLNGTAFAIGRTLIAILENFQQKDGSVKIPKVLQDYVGKSVISPKS